MILRVKTLLLSCLALISFNVADAFAQYPNGPVKPILLKDTLGNILTNKATSLNLFISTDSLGVDAYILNQKDGKPSVIKPENQGKHRISLIDPRRRQVKSFHFFVDGEPPKSSFFSKEGYITKNDTIIGSTNLKLSISAVDNMSGVKNIFTSINNEAFKLAPEFIGFPKQGSYNLKFYAVDNVGNIEKTQNFTIIVDDSPPITILDITTDSHENIVSGRSRFNLISKDEHGVKETWYWFNDEEPALFRNPVPVARFNEGYHKFHYYSVNKLGNKEDVNTFNFYIDKTPPIIFEEIIGNTFIRGGREYSSGRSQLRITAIDNKAGVKEIHYTFDDRKYHLYEGPVFLSMVSGDISIRSYALDNVNNKSYSSTKGTSISIPYIDLNAPEISHAIRGPQIILRDTIFISPKTQIILNAVDHESGLKSIIYRISNQSESEYNKAFSIPEKGFYKIHYSAFDNVDNANTDNFSVFVDNKGPEIKVDYSIKSYSTIEVDEKNLQVYPEHLKVFLSASDTHTGTERITFSLNNGRPQAYRGFISNFKRNSENHIKISATDVLGNESVKEITFYIE